MRFSHSALTEKFVGRISHIFLSTKLLIMTVNPSSDLVFAVNCTIVKQFKSFPYLGSLVIIDGGALVDVHTHIKKVNVVFVNLYPVRRNKNTLIRIKIR